MTKKECIERIKKLVDESDSLMLYLSGEDIETDIFKSILYLNKEIYSLHKDLRTEDSF